MTLKKNYFSTIFIGLLVSFFFVMVFNIQNYYIQKFYTLESTISSKKDLSYLNDNLLKANHYYQFQIEKFNNNLDKKVDSFKTLGKKREDMITDINSKYQQLQVENKKSIHRFVANMLRYNPYLLEQQLIDEVAIYFDTSLMPLKIEIKQNSLLEDEKIVVRNEITKSILQDGRELNIFFKNVNSFTTSFSSGIIIKKLNIKPFHSDIVDLQLENKPKANSVKRFISFDELLLVLVVILFIMLFRLLWIVRYNNKVEKLFLEKIRNVEIIDEDYFTRKKNILKLVKTYNSLILLKGNIMKESSSLEKQHQQFIADSIHQIKTPLSAIMINLDLIEMSIDTTNINQFISQMKTSIDMLTLTYEELSYLSMNNSLEYKSTYLNLSETIQNRLEFFKQIALNNDKKIVSTVLSKLYSTINKIEFERIIDNNLINAIKYSKSDTTIEVSFIKKDETKYELTIASKGNKIENSEDIFKRHYREEEGKRGHGLGLAITKEICDKYNIDIEYKREEEKNSFIYTINVT